MSDWKNVQYKDGKMRTSEGGGGGGSSTFAGLDDVSFDNIQNGQVPKYNSETQKWENADESGGGGTVTDVTVDGVSVVNGQGVAEIETPNADGIEYDNQQSGLSATDVQSAIDELAQGSGGGGVEDVEVNGTSVVNAQNVAEITSYKEVTLAEYQALPSSKTSDGVMYCIKDVGGANQFPPLIYSDEEREIGVWRDGKPLYQKCVNLGALPNTNEKIVSISGLNVENLISLFGFAKNDVYAMPLPYVSTVLTNQVQLSKSGDSIQIITGRDRSSWNGWAIIQYTKTTDTAGSGTWNQQGGYAHHYSTSEKVIGTWIDGKPLYEKVFEQTTLNLTANTWSQTTIPKGNMKYIVDAWVVIENDSAPSIHRGMSGGFVSGYLALNSFRAVSLNVGYVAYVVVQYTKTTD